jgi:hypothetical protein
LLQCPTPETREPLAGLLIHVVNTLVPIERPLYEIEEPSPEEMDIDSKNTKKKLKQVLPFIQLFANDLRQKTP